MFNNIEFANPTYLYLLIVIPFIGLYYWFRQWKDSADAWFLDGFAPVRNPDMWSEELMGAVFAHTAPGGSFATYTAAGWVRRNLEAAGFSVNKQEGYAGKRDMTVGSKVS